MIKNDLFYQTWNPILILQCHISIHRMFSIFCCFRFCHLMNISVYIINWKIPKSDIMKKTSGSNIMNCTFVNFHPKCCKCCKWTYVHWMLIDIWASLLNNINFFNDPVFFQHTHNNMICCFRQFHQFFIFWIQMSFHDMLHFIMELILQTRLQKQHFILLFQLFLNINLCDSQTVYFCNILRS